MATQQEVTACGTLEPTFVVIVDHARRWAEEVLDAVSGFEDVYNTDLDEVRNTPCDGFIPFTEGGFNGIGYATMSAAHGSGSTPKAIQPYLDQAIKDAEEAWDADHPDATVAMIYADPEPVALEKAGQLVIPGVGPTPDYLREHPLREDWYNFETESLQEGGTYFYKVRVLFYDVDNSSNQTGKPEAYFFVGINTDFEYGRDSIPWMTCYGKPAQQTAWLWEKNFALEDLTDDLVDEMIAEASSALRNA